MDKTQEKTVKSLIALLEEFKLQKCSYSNVVRGLTDYGWEKCLVFSSEIPTGSRVSFMWMFDESETYPTEVTLFTRTSYRGLFCYIKLDGDTYKVVPPGESTIKEE